MRIFIELVTEGDSDLHDNMALLESSIGGPGQGCSSVLLSDGFIVTCGEAKHRRGVSEGM